MFDDFINKSPLNGKRTATAKAVQSLFFINKTIKVFLIKY